MPVGSGTSDTTGSVGIPGVGTVFFRNYTISTHWGRLNANNGVLRSADGSTVSVPVTEPLEGTTLRGDGWSATLNLGWVVRPGHDPAPSLSFARSNLRWIPAKLNVCSQAKPNAVSVFPNTRSAGTPAILCRP